MADINEILLRFTGEDDDAQDTITNLIALLNVVGEQDPEAHVELTGTQKAIADALSIFAAVTALDNTDVDIDIEVNTARDTDRTLGGFLRSLGGLVGAGQAASDAIGRVGFSLGPFGAALNPVTALIAVLVLAVGFALVGALGALVASLAAAVAGLGALATALAAAAGPAVLLAIGVFERFAKVLEAYKATQDSAAQSARDSARGTGAVVQAARALEDAQRNLTRSAAALESAETQAYREMADAAEAAEDAVRSLARAQLSQEQAALNVDQAKLALDEFRQSIGLAGKEFDAAFNTFEDVNFDPSKLNKALSKIQGPDLGADEELELRQKILDLKDARLSEKEAIDGVSDATTNLQRAQQKYNDFLEQGISASQGYASALQAQEDAQRALNRAQEQVGITTAEAKRQQLVDDLTRSEQRLLGVLLQLRKVFDQVFGPGVQAIIRGIATSLEIILGAVRPLRSVFRRLGGVIGGAFVRIAKALATPEMITFFGVLADGAAKIVGPVLDAFLALLTIFMNIAKAALPLLIPLLQVVADWLTGLAKKSGDAKTLNDFIGDLVGHLITWVNLGIGFFNLFFNLFKTAAPFGRELAQGITKIADQLSRWADSAEGRAQLKRFFENAIPFALEFVRLLFAIVKVLGRMSIIIIDVFNAIETFIGWIDKALQASEKFVDKIDARIEEGLGQLIDFLGGIVGEIFGLVKDVFNAAVTLGKSIINGIINGIKSVPGGIKDAIKTVLPPGIKQAVDLLDSHSPSQVFFDLGTGVTEGFVKGIESGAKSITDTIGKSLGVPAIAAGNALSTPGSATGAAGFGGGGGTVIEHQEVILPPAPGHDQMGDATHQAAQFAKELRRRGRR